MQVLKIVGVPFSGLRLLNDKLFTISEITNKFIKFGIINNMKKQVIKFYEQFLDIIFFTFRFLKKKL